MFLNIHKLVKLLQKCHQPALVYILSFINLSQTLQMECKGSLVRRILNQAFKACGRLAGCLVGWLVGWLVSQSNQPTNHSTRQLANQPTSQLANQPINQPTSQLTNQQTNQLTNQPTNPPTDDLNIETYIAIKKTQYYPYIS